MMAADNGERSRSLTRGLSSQHLAAPLQGLGRDQHSRASAARIPQSMRSTAPALSDLYHRCAERPLPPSYCDTPQTRFWAKLASGTHGPCSAGEWQATDAPRLRTVRWSAAVRSCVRCKMGGLSPTPPPHFGGRIRPNSPQSSAELLGFWIVPKCSTDLLGFCILGLQWGNSGLHAGAWRVSAS